MNRREPYIGMPIDFDDFDDFEDFDAHRGHDDHMACCGTMEIQQPKPSAQPMQPMALAMAYVPWQKWTQTYPYEEGLHMGTIFPELNLPFEGRRIGGMHR